MCWAETAVSATRVLGTHQGRLRSRSAEQRTRTRTKGMLTMTKFVMLITTAAACLCMQPLAAVADEVPTYDVKKSCHADVQAYPTGGSAAGCLADEQRARNTLVSQWTQFGAESRARCSQLENDIPGDQSYVELLTCLQTAKDVKTLRKD